MNRFVSFLLFSEVVYTMNMRWREIVMRRSLVTHVGQQFIRKGCYCIPAIDCARVTFPSWPCPSLNCDPLSEEGHSTATLTCRYLSLHKFLPPSFKERDFLTVSVQTQNVQKKTSKEQIINLEVLQLFSNKT